MSCQQQLDCNIFITILLNCISASVPPHLTLPHRSFICLDGQCKNQYNRNLFAYHFTHSFVLSEKTPSPTEEKVGAVPGEAEEKVAEASKEEPKEEEVKDNKEEEEEDEVKDAWDMADSEEEEDKDEEEEKPLTSKKGESG